VPRHADVARYLLDRGLLEPRTVVDDGLGVFDVSSRHSNYKVVAGSGPSYLLKQGSGRGTDGSIAGEAAVYEHLGQGEMERFLPRAFLYDADEDVLALELVEGHNLHEHHLRSGRFSTTVAASLGSALGTLHRVTRLDSTSEPSSLPWPLSLHRPDLTTIRSLSAANIELVKIVQRHAEFAEELDALAREWRPQCLIHTDVKLDNCIVPPGRRPTVKLVDWELAGAGDPCWDIGSVFSHYLSLWLLSIPITGEAPPERWPELAKYPLARIRPALDACWRAYCEALELETAEEGEVLLRSIRFAAARLLQTGVEQSQYALQLWGSTICLLQLSLNVLTRPEEAALTLLGLPYRLEAAV
jgi:Phosphotransferase enzyme family